mgnify:CR=1 FL=1
MKRSGRIMTAFSHCQRGVLRWGKGAGFDEPVACGAGSASVVATAAFLAGGRFSALTGRSDMKTMSIRKLIKDSLNNFFFPIFIKVLSGTKFQ